MKKLIEIETLRNFNQFSLKICASLISKCVDQKKELSLDNYQGE